MYHCILAGNFTRRAAGATGESPRIENCIIVHNRGYGLWDDGVSAVAFRYNFLYDIVEGNFQDCDPELGRVVKRNGRGDPVDTAGNLLTDPIFAGTDADSVAFFRALAAPPKRPTVLKIKLPALFTAQMPDTDFTQYRSKNRPR